LPFVFNTEICGLFCREKKKEKEREELWKRLDKLEIESRNNSTTSASTVAGNPSSSAGSSGTSKS